MSPPTGTTVPVILTESIWRSPLLPIALTYTAGVALDRYADVPWLLSLLMGGAFLLAFAIAQRGRLRHLSLVYLALVGVAFAAAYHHYRHSLFPDDDIGYLVSDTPRAATLLGTLDEEPRRLPASPKDPLRSTIDFASATTILRVSHLRDANGDVVVSGRVRLVATGATQPLLADLHAGDEVEVSGRIAAVASRANPGEFDHSGYWHDRGVHAVITIRAERDQVRRVRELWPWSPRAWLALLRTKAHDVLERALPDEATAGLARALLLGEGAPLTRTSWRKYVNTGVVHVLAISGQHLVVVAWFLWTLTRLCGLRQRHVAIIVALVLLAYAVITGGRPPALRAAVAACAFCTGLVMGRPMVIANLLALAWLVVGLWQPADLFEQGCQLSFLAVAILAWGATWLLQRERDPLDDLVDRLRAPWLRVLRRCGRLLLESYAVALIVWAAITPLAAFHNGLVAPAALILGPPLTLLTSIALLAGFVVLLLAPIAAWAAWLPAMVIHAFLRACEWLVDLAERWPIHVHVGELPLWWVVIFYLVLLAALTHGVLRQRWRWLTPAGVGWLSVAVLLGAAPLPANELRCTFLAVGHGTAIVLELPDGRTVLYDAGSLRGPEVTSRILAPYLWSRRIQKLDDVILSHADLDHFNGLASLAECFAIGRVLTSPTFADRRNDAVRHVLAVLEQRRIRMEILEAGDRLTAGAVTMEVLHPVRGFQGSNENTRSLVIEVRHRDHVVLLTGDLEKEGLQTLLRRPPRRVDVLMAPHHGSTRVDGRAILRWCRPFLVISCQGLPRGNTPAEAIYPRNEVEFWTTHARGAITLRSTAAGLTAEGFRDGTRWQRRQTK